MRVKLKDICEILDNKRIPLSKNERAERIKNKNLDELYPYYGATQQAGYIDDYIFDDTLILLGEDGVMFYDRSKPKAYLISGKSWVNNHAHVLKVKEDVAVINYVLYYLNIFDYHGFVSGSTRLKLNKSKMENIEIPLPPLTKQKAIAKKLDLAKELIELRKESIKKLDELAKSVFVDMFGDPVENEMGWEVDKLSKFCDFENGDRSSKYPSAEDLVEEGILFLSSREIVDFRFKPSNSNFITEEKYGQLSQGHCKQGDVLMTLRGNGRGKCCIFKGKYNIGFINAQMVILRFHTKMINTFFIELIRNERMFDNLLRIGSGSAQPQITASALKAIPLILPPITLQQKFAKTIQKIEAQKSLYGQELVKLEEGFAGLLQESFS